jgi:hypothetical protein
MLNGPAIGGPEVKQDSIDALFDGDDTALDGFQALKKEIQNTVTVLKTSETDTEQKKILTVIAPEKVELAAAIEAVDLGDFEIGKTNSQDEIDALFD